MPTSPSNPTTTKGNEEEEKGETSKPPSQMATHGLEFLNRAATSRLICRGLQCTIEQVEEVKIVIRILPIFVCTIMLNCCLAQLSTFSIQQAATMDTKVGSLKVPPASLPVFL